MKRGGIFAILFISIILLSVSIVTACSCIEQDPPKEAMKESSAVFIGEIISIKEITKESGGIGYVKSREALFNVSKIWKGPKTKEITVSTSGESTTCGFGFQVGREYLIYAHGNEKLSTNICSRTKTMTTLEYSKEKELIEIPNSLAQADIAELDSPKQNLFKNIINWFKNIFR